MDIKKQLNYCKICNNKDFNLDQGIVCGLSGQKPDFVENCVHFSENTALNKYSRADEESDLSDLKKLLGHMLRGKFVFTPIVLLTCFIMYLITVKNSSLFLLPDEQSLIRFGGNLKPYTINGEYWRLLTAIFLHGNLAHLIMNMYAFIAIGFLLERQIGTLKMIIVFLINALVASSVSILWDDMNMSIGASGPVYGMFGIYLVLLTARIFDRTTSLIILISMSVYVAAGIIMGLKPGIDIGAHFGGLVSGIIIGIFLRPYYTGKENVPGRALILSGGLLFNLFFVYVVLSSAPDAENRFYRKAIEAGFEEREAMMVYENANYRDFDTKSSLINGNVMPRFRKCRRLLTEALAIEDLPEDLEYRGKLKLEYYNYSLRLFELKLLVNIFATYDFRTVIEYYEDYCLALNQKLDTTDQIDPVIPENPMMHFLSQIPDHVLVVYDGIPYPDREDMFEMDLLELNSIRVLDSRTTESLYGGGYSHSLLFESRSRAIQNIDRIKDVRRKNYLKEIYGV